jgi:hypothetical protein
MLSGVALALSELPLELITQRSLERRLYDRGGERGVQFLSPMPSVSCRSGATDDWRFYAGATAAAKVRSYPTQPGRSWEPSRGAAGASAASSRWSSRRRWG